MQAQVGDLKFTGSATVPRHCDPDGPCGPGLDLQFDTLDAAQLNELLNPTLKKQPWYKLFGSSQEESLLTKIYAVGRVSAKQITFDKLVGTKFYADFRLNHGDLLVSNVRAAVLGGTHEGEWRADFTGATPVYTGSGTATRLQRGSIRLARKGCDGTRATFRRGITKDVRDGMLAIWRSRQKERRTSTGAAQQSERSQ